MATQIRRRQIADGAIDNSKIDENADIDITKLKDSDKIVRIKESVDIVIATNFLIESPDVIIENQRILLVNQLDKSENGIYTYSEESYVRTNDFNSVSKILNSIIFCKDGSIYFCKSYIESLGDDIEFEKLNNITETDPVFLLWLSTTPPAYIEDIPTHLSQLSEDEDNMLVTSEEKSTWNSKQDSGDYATVDQVNLAIKLAKAGL